MGGQTFMAFGVVSSNLPGSVTPSEGMPKIAKCDHDEAVSYAYALHLA